MISLTVYPSQFQCFKVTFYILLKWKSQREITRLRPIHSSAANGDRGLMASTFNFLLSIFPFKPGPEFMTQLI